jgi:hypothetical protein
MTNASAVTDLQIIYEEESVLKLPIILSALGISVVEPVDGFRRSFNKAEFLEWPFAPSDIIEIDCFAHTSNMFPLPVLTNAPLANGCVVTTSPIAIDPVHTEASVSLPTKSTKSPEKVQEKEITNVPPTNYVVAEVLYGGKKALIPKKAEQLEKDVVIAFMKSFGTKPVYPQDIISAVEVAIVITQQPLENAFFEHINSNRSSYVHLYALKERGRLVFVCNPETPAKMISNLKALAITQGEKIEELATVVVRSEEDHQRLEETLEQQQNQINELKAILGKLLDGSVTIK